MSILIWNESLSVEIESIDEQHQYLFKVINDFYDALKSGSQKQDVSQLLKSLKRYTITHFTTEEKYMKAFDFSDYERHKAEHAKFIEAVAEFEDRFQNGKLILSLEITNFLKNWITEHIQKLDKEYSALLINKGVK
jgi:hemerythrin